MEGRTIEEDATKVLAVGEDVGLIREGRAARFNCVRVDEGQLMRMDEGGRKGGRQRTEVDAG